jgi:hypothetical protein
MLTSSTGAEVPVNNLSVPIYFQLPVLTQLGSSPNVSATCQYWDDDPYDETPLPQYSSAGCTGIPDPRPPGHTLSWLPGFTAVTDADMAGAWSIDGPLVANCTTQVLDCSPSAPPVAVFPNPAAPLTVPAVTCNPNISTAPLLVFVGSRCALIQPGNAYACNWDNVKQAFVGAGCVASNMPADCACRHVRGLAACAHARVACADASAPPACSS